MRNKGLGPSPGHRRKERKMGATEDAGEGHREPTLRKSGAMGCQEVERTTDI